MEEIQKEEQLHHLVSVENLEGLKRKINITIDTVGVDLALDGALDVVSKKVQVNGFRKGKAPKKMIEKIHSEEIKNLAIFMLTQSGFSRACAEQNLTPLGEPKVDLAEICVDGSFKCEVLVEVKPIITPTGYIGMSLNKPVFNINEAFDQRLSDLKKYHCIKEVRSEISEGFEVMLDFWVLVDGNIISENKDKSFTINKGKEAPFGENLLGAKMGDMATHTMILPQEYPQHGGKQAEVKMDLKLVLEKIEPSNDQLIEKMKAPSFEELSKVIREDIEKSFKNQERANVEEQILTKLIDLHEFSVPEAWVADEEKYLASQLGVSNPDGEFLKNIKSIAERNVKRTFLIEAIYEVEKNLKLTEEEIELYIKSEAERLNMSSLALKSELKKQNMIDGVVGLLKNNKIIDFIISTAKIEESKCVCNCSCDCETQNECLCNKEKNECLCGKEQEKVCVCDHTNEEK